MAKNKVKFGLKNVYVWPITEATSEKVTYGEVIRVPGAVSLSLEASGDSNPFYADDMIYWIDPRRIWSPNTRIFER